jgi:hypothetical protein
MNTRTMARSPSRPGELDQGPYSGLPPRPSTRLHVRVPTSGSIGVGLSIGSCAGQSDVSDEA